jgi:hypothetical protein
MPRKAPGGPRDAVLNVRIPERVKFGLQLLSRHTHVPVPDVVIRALEDAFTAEHGGLMVDLPGEDMPRDLLKRVWDERESVRLAKLAFIYPSLLSLPEQRLWQQIKADDKYWRPATAKGRKRKDGEEAHREASDLLLDTLEGDWPRLKTAMA